MRIAVIGKFGPEDFGTHIKDELEHMGNEVQTYNFGPLINLKNQDRNLPFVKYRRSLFEILSKASRKTRQYSVTKELYSFFLDKKLDLIICTKDWLLDYEVDMIRKLTSAKIVLWYPDAVVNFGRSFFMSAGYDALFFKDSYIVDNLRSMYQKNVHYLPECFNPRVHRPVEYNEKDEHKYKCDISLIGNLHPFRVELLKTLNQYDVKVYGSSNPWWLNIRDIGAMYTGEYLTYLEKSRAIKHSKISLNTVHIGEINGVNVRTFEIAGAGGFQLVQQKRDLADLFEVGKEIVTYGTLDELRHKVDYYLEHERERLQIAKAGQQRAWNDHTYNDRMKKMLKIVFQ